MRSIIYAILGIVIPIFTLAQTYSFQHIGVEEGLSQSVVTSVVQDDEGVFWIGTMAGLTRYDGNRFSIYMKNHGLVENWVTTSFKDKGGNLWFGHWGGGVSFFDAELKEFKDMRFERFSNFKSITDIVEDRHGDIWFSTRGAGIFKYETKGNAVVSLNEEDGFLSDNVNCLATDQNKNIWMGTNKGVVIYRGAKSVDEEGAFMLVTEEDGLSANNISDICFLDDVMIIASEYDGFTLVENITNLTELTYENIDKSDGLLSEEITCLFGTSKSDLWIGTGDRGILRYDVEKNNTKALSTRQGLNYFKVNTIFQDRENNTWIGTDLGLNLFRGDQFLIYDETDGLINNVIWSIAEDEDEHLWIGTNNGLSRVSFVMNEETGVKDKTVVRNYSRKDGLSSNIISAVFVAPGGDVWCGTGLGGISIVRKSGGISVIDSTDGLGSNKVYSITQDNSGNFWVGTDKGASMIDAGRGIMNYTTENGLGGDNIYKVFNDSKGNIWFASIGGSLSNFSNGKFTVFDNAEDLSQKFITSISEDKSGNIWFGAYGGGLFKYDGNAFTNFSINDGLSSNSPYSIIADDYNNLWIGTSQGVDKFNLEDGTFKNYREKEGFMGIEPNPNAIYKDHDGNIWFGTIMGAVKFDLSHEKTNAIEPVTILEKIKVNYDIFEFPEGDEFSHDENHITFHYVGISLTNPEHVEYKYMLEGFDIEWSPVTTARDVVYSNIPPGEYTFKVMAANNDGVWNELPTSYSFTINPPFWQTWWFITLCVILIALGIYIGDKIRMKKLLEAKQVLETKVAERTAEVVEQKKVVEEKNGEILDSIKYAKRIQEAILPPTALVKKHLKDSFILYKAKDIVAGDFYWFETKGDDIYFAAADCTGHGVPGAMVSVVCANALNRTVNEMNITEPAKILDKVRELVVATFEKSEQDVKDGMDIAFCKLNTKTRKLTFTGAHNSLYRVTNKNGEEMGPKDVYNDKHRLHEYKGDKQPIGKYAFEKPFKQEEIQLNKGDYIYVSTDGFPDQFGGEKGKKFMYKPFKKMFLSMHGKPLDKQKQEIDDIFEDWKGIIDQIDDVCIIGLKVD